MSVSSVECTSAKKLKPKPKIQNKENNALNTAKPKKQQIITKMGAAASATIKEDNILASG
jgi:hypothetical protein